LTVLGDLAQGTSPWARAAGSTVELRGRRPVDTALTAALLRPVPLHARTASAILLWLRKPPA
jgi:hypothetical protein